MLKFSKAATHCLFIALLLTLSVQIEIELETYEYVNELTQPASILWKHTLNLAKKTHNLTELKLCLMKSFIHDKSSYPVFYLAKFTLFGYPKVVPAAQDYNLSFCDDFKLKNEHSKKKLDKMLKDDPLDFFKRNISLSFTYFLSAHQFGHQDAPAYIYFLLKQNLIHNNFLGNITTKFPSIDYLLHLLTVGSNRGSYLSKVLILAETLVCLKSKNDTSLFNLKYPKLLTPSFQDFLNGPYIKRPCHTCQEILQVALIAGAEALTFLQERGGETPSPPKFEETQIQIQEESANAIAKESYSDEYYLLQSAANKGNVEAQDALGQMHLLGNPANGVPRDPPQALEYFSQAASSGNVQSLYNMGLMYSNGIGVDKNGTKAKESFEKAISLGGEQSYSGLAFLHLHGIGVKKNATKAIEYFEKAAATGNAEAESNLGALYLEELKNDKKAAKYFRMAAQKKQLSAMYNLGVLYLRGIEVNSSCVEILEYILELCSRVDKLNLREKALNLYKRGDLEGSYLYSSLGAMLGIDYHFKNLDFLFKEKKWESCKNDDSVICRSVYLYKRLFIFGYDSETAIKMADLMFYGSKNFEKNYEMSVDLYKKIAHVSPEAAFSLSFMYEKGYGVEKDLEKSREILESIKKSAWSQKIAFENYWPALIAIGKLDLIVLWNKISHLLL